MTASVAVSFCGILLTAFAERNREKMSKLTREILLQNTKPSLGTEKVIRCHIILSAISVLSAAFPTLFRTYLSLTNSSHQNSVKMKFIIIISSEFTVLLWGLIDI